MLDPWPGGVGPDIGATRPQSIYAIVAGMWNHLPQMSATMDGLGRLRAGRAQGASRTLSIGEANMTGARKLGIGVAAALVVGVTGFAALRTAEATGPEVTVYRSPT